MSFKLIAVHRGIINNELGKLVCVTGSFGFICHKLKISTASREGKLLNFKLTHYPNLRQHCRRRQAASMVVRLALR